MLGETGAHDKAENGKRQIYLYMALERRKMKMYFVLHFFDTVREVG